MDVAESIIEEIDYRNHPAISQSDLKIIKHKSLSHFRNRYQTKDTPAMLLGRAIHAAVFEPDVFARDYSKVPSDLNRRTKKGRDQYDKLCEDSTPLSEQDWNMCGEIAARLAIDKDAAPLIEGCEFEKSLFATDQKTGIDIKGRLDGYKPGLIVDLKTTLNGEPTAFTRDIFRYGYHFQAAFYIDLVERVTGEYCDYKIIAVEKSYPYAVSIFELSDKTIAIGRQDYKIQLSRLALARKNNDFPSYPKTKVSPPSWLEAEWFKNV